ncbi:hypothetical protein ANO11243_039450 [Dothideomycetidae sp. 11243]|nr:hypothetical protein ANO11243_039450 [fungal sp. No.11243]
MPTDASNADWYLKDGKPFLERYLAGPTVGDARNQGFNFCIQSTFASREDLTYYDESCEAHDELKALMQGRLSGPPLTVFTDEFVGE